MIRRTIKHLVAHENEKVADAFWRFRKEPLLTIVANDDGKYVGIVAEHDYDMVGLTQGGY